MRRIRKLLSMIMAFVMILALLPAAVFAADAPAKLYLKPNSNWLADNARFAAYFFGNGEKWVSMTDADSDGIYEVEVPSGFPDVIFCRMNPNDSANNWNNKWNQTADLTVPTDGTNLYTVKSGTWDSGGGTWSTHAPAVEEETTTPGETTLPDSGPVTVYFVNADGWDKVNAYVWDADENYLAAWPGTEITATGETVNGFDVYEFTFDSGYDSIIFNNGSAQTSDQTPLDGQYFDYASNAWYESVDDIPYVDPLVTPHVLMGSFNGWSVSENVFMLDAEGGRIGYTSLDLEANTTYEFKIIQDGTWTSCATPITGTAEDLAFNSSVSDNATIATTIAGTYTFAFNLDSLTLSVTYPECNHNYVDGVCTNCGEAKPIENYDLIVYYDNSDTQWEKVYFAWHCTEVCWSSIYPGPMTHVEGNIFKAQSSVTCSHSVDMWVYSGSVMDGEPVYSVHFEDVRSGDTLKHTHSFAEGKCTVCSEPDPDYVEPVTTAYFINSGAWDEAYAYAWNASQEPAAAWPGTVMTGTGEKVNGFDVYEITVDTSCINVIFHNNIGNQTADLTLMDGQYYDFTSNTWYESVDDIPGNETPAETMTIYFQNNWLWDDICLYYWGSTAAEDPAWPGIPMEYYENDGNYDVFCLEVPTDIGGMIINGIMNDGSGERDKTPDIEGGWYDGICYYMLWNDGNAVGSEDIGVILPDSDTPTYTIYFDPQGAAIDGIHAEYRCEEHWDSEVRYSADFEYDSNIGLWAATFRGSCSEGCVERIGFELSVGDDWLPMFTEDLIDGKTYTVPSADPTITREGSTLSYEDLVYVIDIFDLQNVDLTAVDLSKDAGLLVWSVEEFEALTEIAYDAAHANVGLKPYGDTGFYYGASDGIYTRYLHEEACYVGYVKLPDGTYIYSQEKVYSPSIYAYKMLGKETTSAATKELCVALLNYISAAQKYFNPGTTPVNKDLTDEQKALVWNSPELNLAPAVPAGKQVTRDTAVFTGTGKNLLFEEMISLVSVYKVDTAVVNAATECGTIFWTAEQFETLTGAPSVENIGEGTKVTGFNVYQGTDGQWYSTAPEVAAKDMSATSYYILGYVIDADGTVHYSGVMSYSFEQYISNTVTKATASTEMIAFAQRLYFYERAAAAAPIK